MKLLLDALDEEKGFSIFEVITVVIIAAILAALAAPNVIGAYRRSQVNKGLDQLKGALQEAQRQAIKASKVCQVTLHSDKITAQFTADSSSCLLSDRLLPDHVTLAWSGSGSNITFGISGNTDTDRTVVIFYSSDNNSTDFQNYPDKRCLAISSPLASMRTGHYSGGDLNNVDGDSYCSL